MAQQLELINSIIEKLDRSVESFNRGTSAQTGTDTVSLVELINRVRLLATPSLPADIKFTCDTRLHGSHACPADPNLIEDLLMNLIKNSCESLVTSGCGGSLGLLVSQNDAGISFRVLDSGPGLSEKAYDEIFVNRRVYTSKPGGWGEGLLGVMNRLRSLGSDLEYFRVDGVTIFQFVLR